MYVYSNFVGFVLVLQVYQEVAILNKSFQGMGSGKVGRCDRLRLVGSMVVVFQTKQNVIDVVEQSERGGRRCEVHAAVATINP